MKLPGPLIRPARILELADDESGGLDLSLGGNADRWSASADLRHRLDKGLDLTAGLLASGDWGKDPNWQATAGLKWRW